jgi:ribosomal protein L11 methyltransferase
MTVADHATELVTHQTTTWLEGWKESFKPIRTERFYIYPPWNPPQGKECDFHMVIEPGMAFGTGQHATTMLCLREIERLTQEDPEIHSAADVGTGTGILAIAMAQLGIPRVIGTDIDSDAVIAAKRNLADNAVHFELLQTSVPPGDYSLVVANILTVVLLKLMQDLARATGRWLLLSGILVEQAYEIEHAATACGLELVRSVEQEGWVSLLFLRKTV